MKKLLLLLSFLIIIPASASTLWEHYNYNLPSVSERTPMATNCGIYNYTGSYEQNIAFLDCLEGQEPFGASTQPAALSTFNLAGSGVSSAATSITLQSLSIPQNDYLIQDSDLSDTFYITLEPGSKVRQEIASCTTVTQNAGGTATLSGCTRGLSPITPYTASSTLKFSHAGGSQVIFSDPPQLFNLYPAKANAEAITGLWTYNTNLPTSTLNATTTYQFTTKTYVDNVTNQGAATSSESIAGIIEQATQAEMTAGTAFDANNPHTINSEYATSSPDVRGNYIPVAEADGYLDQDWIDLSEDRAYTGDNTMATTTMDKLTVGGEASIASTTLTGNTIVEYSAASTSPATVGYVNSFVEGYNSNAELVTNNPSFQLKTIAHGLGKIPSRIKVSAVYSLGAANINLSSFGTYDGTNMDFIRAGNGSTSGGTSAIAELDSGSSNVMTATSTFDSTNIYIGWTETNTFPGTIFYLWEAWTN